jgi:hypothetical protein
MGAGDFLRLAAQAAGVEENEEHSPGITCSHCGEPLSEMRSIECTVVRDK